jgi:hypothetical protein
MPLWTDLIDPEELTGYARASLEAYEESTGSLQRYLPNTTVDDIHVKFEIGENGLVESAEFRAWDTEPSIGRQGAGKSVTLELPAIGHKRVVSEYRQLRLRNASEGALRQHILKNTDQAIKAVVNRIELLRGVVLDTGKATVNQRNFQIDDDFGRPAEHNVTAAALWSADTATSRLDDLFSWQELYMATNNGRTPGSMLMSTRVYRSLAAGDEFLNQTTGRPLSRAEVNGILVDEGLPTIDIYDRRTLDSEGNLTGGISNNKIIMLPSPGEADDMGHSYWGVPLVATEEGWGIGDEERAGVVAGVLKSDNVPVLAEVVTDAIAMPVLGNAALTLAATVLPAS